ncbi:hypothetical protein DL93DRAFT_2038660, partial [Clavulina sp. PMI_390]
ESLVDEISKEWALNEKQNLAFCIMASQFQKIMLQKSDTDNQVKPLRMFMEGPGGTGKTHVLRALQSLMSRYGCAHRIRFLAPTGGAAALLDGQTIHRGLGISELAYHLSLKKREELRKEWHNVLFVVIDEVSMV